MIKIAYNKENPSLVYEVDSIDRVDVSSTGNSGIIEKYVGTVKDTKNNTESKNVKISVLDFDVKWEEVPIDVVETGTEIHNQEKAVTPTTSQQVVSPDTGYTGLNKVTVAGVTSAIDANITAENIKKDTTILGVTGSLESGGAPVLHDWTDNNAYRKTYFNREVTLTAADYAALCNELDDYAMGTTVPIVAVNANAHTVLYMNMRYNDDGEVETTIYINALPLTDSAELPVAIATYIIPLGQQGQTENVDSFITISSIIFGVNSENLPMADTPLEFCNSTFTANQPYQKAFIQKVLQVCDDDVYTAPNTPIIDPGLLH